MSLKDDSTLVPRGLMFLLALFRTGNRRFAGTLMVAA